MGLELSIVESQIEPFTSCFNLEQVISFSLKLSFVSCKMGIVIL